DGQARARLRSRILELQQVALVQRLRGGGDELGEGGGVVLVTFALEPVDERLENQRQPAAVAVVRRAGKQLPLLCGTRGMVGAVPEEKLAPVRAESQCVRRVELEAVHASAVERLVTLGLERRQQAGVRRTAAHSIRIEQDARGVA